MLQNAISIREATNASCVAIQNNVVMTSYERGIRPLLCWLKAEHGLQNAVVADKVIGKAAALLLVYGKVKEVFAQTISEQALVVFLSFQIPVTYNNKVKWIQNRDQTGLCPMEQKCMTINEPMQAYQLFSQLIK